MLRASIHTVLCMRKSNFGVLNIVWTKLRYALNMSFRVVCCRKGEHDKLVLA